MQKRFALDMAKFTILTPLSLKFLVKFVPCKLIWKRRLHPTDTGIEISYEQFHVITMMSATLTKYAS
jgi:hypothetical protein